MALPPCGLYRTTKALAEGIPAGRLVYFHNHGEPGPGVYLPHAWKKNRAQWHAQGQTLSDAERDAQTLEPLPAEGFYRVIRTFDCCEKKCVTFEPEQLVQLGYDALAEAIVFVPQFRDDGLLLPEHGSAVRGSRLGNLAPLRVGGTQAGGDSRWH